MRTKHAGSTFASVAIPIGLSLFMAGSAFTQRRLDPEAALIAKRNAIEQQLQDIAIVDRKVMVKMRDGKLMAADI